MLFLSIKEIESKKEDKIFYDNNIRITVEYDDEEKTDAYCVYAKRGETENVYSAPYRFWAYHIQDVIQYLRYVTGDKNNLNVTLYSAVFDEDEYTGDDDRWFSQFETLEYEVVGFKFEPLSDLEKIVVDGLRILKKIKPC
jgi:hypothetical protein